MQRNLLNSSRPSIFKVFALANKSNRQFFSNNQHSSSNFVDSFPLSGKTYRNKFFMKFQVKSYSVLSENWTSILLLCGCGSLLKFSNPAFAQKNSRVSSRTLTHRCSFFPRLLRCLFLEKVFRLRVLGEILSYRKACMNFTAFLDCKDQKNP